MNKEYYNYLFNYLSKKYENQIINGNTWFKYKSLLFRPFSISDYKAIGIEYADSVASIYQAEDGELFYPKEYSTKNDFALAVLTEIEKECNDF